LLTSCSTSASARIGPEARPKVLRYAFTSMSEDVDTYSKRLDVVKAYLEKTLNMPVEVMKTSNFYSAVIEVFRANKIDLASISPFSYVIATQTIPIEAIVMRGSKQGEPGDYTGVLAVPSDTRFSRSTM
jgi:ABC-type phosphate/phosphonate transport system substrate-binding protein